MTLSTASPHSAIALASANFSGPKPVMGTILLHLIVSVLISVLYVRARTPQSGTGVGAGAKYGRASVRRRSVGRRLSPDMS